MTWPIHLHFLSFHNTGMMQVFETFPHGRQNPICFTWLTPWLLMTWWRKEPGHHQPWYWPSLYGIFHFMHQRGLFLASYYFLQTKAINVKINSLWPSDIICRQRSWSTLAQVMARCLTASSHYLNQCWLFINKVEGNLSAILHTRHTSAMKQQN